MIIEEVTGSTYELELEQRIARPLGLDSTELPTTRHLPDLDDAGENPFVPWAAGSVVSNAQDLARFVSAALSGRILSQDLLAHIRRADPDSDKYHPLGMYSIELPCGQFWCCDGSILDYRTHVWASDDGSLVAVVARRGGRDPGSVEGTALLCPNAPASPT